MIVGVDGRKASRQIGQHKDRAVGHGEPPRLGVVAVGGQCRVANKGFLGGRRGQVETVAVAPERFDRSLVAVCMARPGEKRGSASCGGDDSGACEESEKTASSGVFHCTRQVCRGLVDRRRRSGR